MNSCGRSTVDGLHLMTALVTPSGSRGFIGMALRAILLPNLEEKIEEITADADLDEEPDSHFAKLLGALDCIEELDVYLDDDARSLIDDAREQVRQAIDTLEDRKRERDEDTEDDTDWTHIVTQKKEELSSPEPTLAKRSVFDDVDK